MTLLAFYGLVVAISLTGVMSPGPLTALTLARGRGHPLAGFWLNVGHAFAETPLILALLAGLQPFLTDPALVRSVSVAGGLYLLAMGAALFRQRGGRRGSAPREEGGAGRTGPPSRGTVAAGAAMTLFNPYWLLWWLTIGTGLLARARGLGGGAVIAGMVALHLACDLGWGTFLSWAAHRGGLRAGGAAWRRIEAGCAAALVLFGGGFLYEGLLRAGS